MAGCAASDNKAAPAAMPIIRRFIWPQPSNKLLGPSPAQHCRLCNIGAPIGKALRYPDAAADQPAAQNDEDEDCGQQPGRGAIAFPPSIIQNAIWLYLRFALSYRDVRLRGLQGRDCLDLGSLLAAQPIKIVPGLQREPQFRAVAAELAQPQRHLRCDGRALGEDGVESLSRHPEKVCDLGAPPAERRQDFLPQQLARMHRRQAGSSPRLDRKW
jgi:hypothetical protein